METPRRLAVPGTRLLFLLSCSYTVDELSFERLRYCVRASIMFYKPGEPHNLPRDPFKACVIVSGPGLQGTKLLAK
jgi:hypothetical protein